MTLTFSLNLYDGSRREPFDHCILLHFNDTAIIRLADMEELRGMIETLNDIVKEIDEHN